MTAIRQLARTTAVALAAAALLVSPATGAQGGGGSGDGAVAISDGADLPPSLEGAPIALMVDLGSGRVLYSREADRRFMPASLTKLMTLYTAFEMIEEGSLSLDQRLPVRDETFRAWSGKGSTMFVPRGAAITVDTLLHAIDTVSANDGCVVLAEGAAGSVPAFTALMNAKARQLGMHDSHWNTPNGWMDEGRTYTSARDLATLAQAIITRHPGLYRRYFSQPSFAYNGITQNNRNPILGAVQGADGLKTGFTNEAGYGFVGSAERNGRRIVMVIGGTESGRARKAIARDFINWGFDDWSARRLYGAGQAVASVALQGGADRTVMLNAERPVFVTVPQGQQADARVSVRYRGPAVAPVRKGDKIATLEITTADGSRGSVPLVAAEDVDTANWWQRLRNGLLAIVT
ncbi:D-alanyl-D-alanine carboxypeptidase family protein [Croceicoccus bisphenolivorans]|uniref:D-alanyl-D-alanine carboxypeptidase family protein n=1 Tax=Croceicoccus bisphenolivorans TaxID=1783232 RepID=UPI0009ED494F|nr:D-alanyl-D-alanine carboxypeptidase family protein [Croceicoccus bisphenolivorans]